MRKNFYYRGTLSLKARKLSGERLKRRMDAPQTERSPRPVRKPLKRLDLNFHIAFSNFPKIKNLCDSMSFSENLPNRTDFCFTIHDLKRYCFSLPCKQDACRQKPQAPHGCGAKAFAEVTKRKRGSGQSLEKNIYPSLFSLLKSQFPRSLSEVYSRFGWTFRYAGRIIFFPFTSSSIRCADQPEIRAVANRGVYNSSGSPSME